LSPSAKCTAISGKPPSIQWARSLEGAKLKTWLDLDFTYDGNRDEITMDIPKGFAGWPDLKTDLTWTLSGAPFRELEGAVFKADNAIVDGSKINATIKFNTDGTLNFTIPQIPMICKKNPYLAGADGGLYMAVYVDGAELGMPKYHVKHDCVGKSLFENGVHIYSFKFTKGFKKIVVDGIVFPTSSSSSSSSDSSDPLPQGSVLCSGQRESEYCDCSFDCTHNKDFCSCEAAKKCCSSRTSELEADAPSSSESSSDSAEEFVLVLNRVADAPKTTFENFWANVLK